MKAVILQHEPHEGLDLLEPALVAAGFTLIKRFRHVEHADLEAALVVVLGGSMGVYEAHEHPFLSHELAFLGERLALDRPTLGVCLGAQLLAAAAGATVSAGKNGLEVGVAPVRLTAAAASDPVFEGLPAKLTVAHWHGDTFTPVTGATLLASTDRYSQQAFRLGHSYGLQFHPELTAASFTHWLDLGEAALRERGKNVDELRGQVGKLAAAKGALEDVCSRLAFRFAALSK
jgi:GMP synthase (glutamine-hydrolysing)